MRYTVLWMVLGMFFTQFSHAGGSVITVGADPACDYDSITAAMFNAPATGLIEIRVAKNVNLSSLQIIDDRDSFIRGGFNTCSSSTTAGRTVLDGSGFTGPIFVASNHEVVGSTVNLTFQDLEISGGNSNTDGGVLSLTGAWALFLDNVWMHDNVSNGDGGAIAIKNSSNLDVNDPAVYINNGTTISFNAADNGGGIACDGGGSVVGNNMQISLNEASVNGGGVFLDNDCFFLLENGQLNQFQGVLFNEAAGFGGGVFATNNSIVSLNSLPTYEASGVAAVYSNTAANGGGIGLTDDARLFSYNALIINNTATSTGGGIRSTGGHIEIRRTLPGLNCHEEIRCSQISGNEAEGGTASFSGGGAIATFGGSLEITGTYIENNTANFGSAIRARFMEFEFGSERNMTLIGNVVAGNDGAPQVIYLDDTSADIAFSTFIDNQGMDRVIEMAYPTTSSSGNSVTVSGSIFDHPGSTLPAVELTTSGQLVNGDCNRNEANATGDLVGGTRSTTIVETFEDRANGDYRLLPNSFLRDWCDGSYLGIGSDHSANGYDRPVDDQSIGDLYGDYDLGGLELYSRDLIFKNGFD